MTAELPTFLNGKGPPRLPSREATDESRGYVAGWAHAVDAVLSGKDDDEVYIEAFEDIVVVAASGEIGGIQVKDKAGSFSISQEEPCRMLERWAAVVEKRPDSWLRFTSTQTAGNLHDRSESFRRWVSGDQTDGVLDELRQSLQTFISERHGGKFPRLEGLLGHPGNFKAFWNCISWQLGGVSLDALLAELLDKVKQQFPGDLEARARERLYAWIGALAMSASSKDIADRRWTRTKLFAIDPKTDVRFAVLAQQLGRLLGEAAEKQAAMLAEVLERVRLMSPTTGSADLAYLRSAAECDAKRLIETKSRQLKPAGNLPATVPLSVSVRVTRQLDRYDSQGRLIDYDNQFVSLPLYQACRRARQTVLLGDLGSGKSTLAAQFVLDTLENLPHGLAFLIPAKALRLPDPFLLTDLIAAFGHYLAGQIAPRAEAGSLGMLLRAEVEVCIVIDGLDEFPRARAASLFRQLTSLVDCWPKVQVLATARPVELAGITYESWGMSRLERLSDADKKVIFQAEAIADGVSDAAESAKKRSLFLKKYPALDELASTPLAVRLLYSKLDGMVLPVAGSIGDLLYDLLIERLGQWSERDHKSNPLERFESEFPTAQDRADILGTLARVVARKRISREEAEEVLRERVGGDYHLAKQALAFFQQAGLISLDEGVGFNFQPLLEMSAGTAMLGRWLGGLAPDSPGQPLPWRIAAFAAAVARRRGLLDRIRPRLQFITDDLLKSSRGVPPACMIASEARDTDLVHTIIDAFIRLGRKPLYFDNDERFTSVRAIAHTIYLAGDKGFEWFEADYLDARYPIVHRGSAVVDEVLHHWTWFAFRTITEEQRRKLRPLVGPLLVQGGCFTFVLPSLAMLVPDAFEEKQLLWHVSAFLDDELLASEAERLLTSFNNSSNRPVLIDIFCRRAQNSRKGLSLFFRLFAGERPPIPIAKGLLRWRAIDPENDAMAEALATCANLAGEERWPRFLRWCLSDEEASVSAGAAILLHERGETRLNTVGEALLNALHDGGYVRRAEQILSDLVGQRGEEGVRWLACHMAARRGWNGGHSGYWRVLLQHLDPSGDHSPEILAGCAVAVGPFLLTRYPEVRDGLQRLLNGPQGEEFRKVLREGLANPDPEIRHGSGSILITCDPRDEADALFVVVATRTGITTMNHEWEPFCLSLAFGSSVLGNLHSQLGQMGHEARAFGLAILMRHHFPLSAAEQESLFGHLLEVGNWSLGGGAGQETGFESEEGFRYLRDQIELPSARLSQPAAKHLLSLFGSRLSPEKAAKCWSLLCSDGNCNPDLLKEQIVQVLRDPAYRTLMSATFEDAARGGSVSLLEHVAATSDNANRWRDVLWKLLYEWHGMCFEVEDMGQILLDLGRDFPEYARPIGEAATHLFQDPRVKDARRGEVRHWLALLAHEFSATAPVELRAVLTTGEWISWNCARALMARFGSVPDGVPHRRLAMDFPMDLGAAPVNLPSAKELLVQTLMDWTRPADNFHPATCDLIGQLLYAGDFDERILDAMAKQGTYGIMISEPIRFCAGLQPALTSRLTLLQSGGLPQDLESDRAFQRLRWNVRTFHTTYLEDDLGAREAYAAAVEQAMRLDTDNIAPFASELLRLRGSLPADQATAVFEDCTRRLHRNQEDLAFGIISWISSLQPGADADAVRQAAEHAIEVLDQRGRVGNAAHFPPYQYLLFPIANWVLGGKASKKSIEIYWHGIRLLFSVSSGQFGIQRSLDLLREFDSLLAKVPQAIWAAVREAAVTSDDPMVRSLVGMLGGFGGLAPRVREMPSTSLPLGPPEAK